MSINSTIQLLSFLLFLSLQRTTPTFFYKFDNKSESVDSLQLDEREGYTFLISGGDRIPEKQKLSRFMVSIRTQTPTRYFGDNHFCAGSIIGPKTVLTAAHCIMDKRKVLTRPRRVVIVAGTPQRLIRSTTTAELAVDSMVSHPKYIRDNTDDIAIIRLKKSFPIDNQFIAIIPLPNGPPPYGQNCTTIGWGRMYYDGPLSDDTSHVDICLISPADCMLLTPEFKKGTFCAGDLVLYNEDPCRGDSGGPMICDGKLTGIISWTIGCGSKVYPSLYTDVHEHMDWIRAHIDIAPACLSYSKVLLLLMLYLQAFFGSLYFNYL